MTNILKTYGLHTTQVYRNPSAALLYEHGLLYEPGTKLSHTGALLAYSGEKTGRSPKDKAVINDCQDAQDFHKEFVNKILPEDHFQKIRQAALDFLNTQKRLYIIDAYIGWDKKYQFKVRVLCTRAYHALFMQNMLITANAQEFTESDTPDYTIINAGASYQNPHSNPSDSTTQILLSFAKQEIIILGTEYAGEMKKGLFTMMNYLMPKKNILSMHCSATEGTTGDVTLLFGLSGTGKTTLSADPNRLLIGDDEHCWTDEGVFNIEGGCYAKVINLSKEKEPDIFQAIRYQTVLENVVYDEHTRELDFTNKSITENTRASYPITFIRNAKIPCTGSHPKNIIFLTCDAFGVLPPISRLNKEQAAYHFIMGYTAKIAGTEVGTSEPKATFSACFGAAFMVWHPNEYAKLFTKKIQQHNTTVWLINTGWVGGPYGVGHRIDLRHTRTLLNAIHSGTLEHGDFERDTSFGFAVPKTCENIPPHILNPRNSWQNPNDYNTAQQQLILLFHKHFQVYENHCEPWIKQGGPTLA